MGLYTCIDFFASPKKTRLSSGKHWSSFPARNYPDKNSFINIFKSSTSFALAASQNKADATHWTAETEKCGRLWGAHLGSVWPYPIWHRFAFRTISTIPFRPAPSLVHRFINRLISPGFSLIHPPTKIFQFSSFSAFCRFICRFWLPFGKANSPFDRRILGTCSFSSCPPIARWCERSVLATFLGKGEEGLCHLMQRQPTTK